MEQKPSVGRIVHVFCRSMKEDALMGIGPYPAIVYKVGKDGSSVHCQAFPRGKLEMHWQLAVPYSDKNGNEGGEIWWEWPERV